MRWLAPDRAEVALGDGSDVQAKRDALARLVVAWMKATT